MLHALNDVNPSFDIFSIPYVRDILQQSRTFQWAFEQHLLTDFSRTGNGTIWMKLFTAICCVCIIISGCKLAGFGFKISKMKFAVAVNYSFKLVQTLNTALGWKWCIVIYLNMYVCFEHLICLTVSLNDWQLCFQTSRIIRSVTVNFVPYQFTSSEETMEPWVMIPELESNIIEYYKFTLECVWMILSFCHLHHNGRATGHAWFLALIGDNFARMGMRYSGNNHCLTSCQWI